jgi:hypothetical protein
MAPKRGRSDTHTRDRRARNRAREDKTDGPDSHSSGNQGEQTVLNRPVVNSPESGGMPGIPHHHGIHRPVRWVDQDSPGRFGIRTPANRGQWDVLSGWDIHSRGEQSNPAAQIRPGAHSSGDRHSREHPRSLDLQSPEDRSKGAFPSSPDIHSWADPNNLGIHSPEDRRRRGIPDSLGTRSSAAHSSDIRILRTRKLGSRNKSPVVVEAYSRLLRLSRSPLQPPLRALLLAHHLPLLQWQHQKPLPISRHQGPAEPDRRGLCRPKGPRQARQACRAQFGSSSLPLTTPTEQKSIRQAATTRSASRFVQQHVSESSVAGSACGDLVETERSPPRSNLAQQRASEWFTRPRVSCPVELYSIREVSSLGSP